MLKMLKKVQRVIREKIIISYSKKNSSPMAYAPYPIKLYDEYISRIKNDRRFKVIGFDENVDKSRVNFIFRHDLDTLQCLKNSQRLVELHGKYSIPLSVYVRMDDIDYDARDSYQYVSPYLEKISLGLHSSCYINNNPLDALSTEINKFHEIYGFAPKFLTLHGLGTYKYDARMELIKHVSVVYSEFGFTFADFIENLRHYDYVVQDCHLNNGKRFLKKDMHIFPPRIKGSCYLLLAHPCYWE